MINNRKMLEEIGAKLNSIASFNDIKVDFVGEIDFYNYDWVKRVFGYNATPFVLVTNSFKTLSDGIGSVTFRYTIVALPFEKDKEHIEFIYDQLYNTLKSDHIDDINIVYRPIKITYGADFSEGSGSGHRRFEALFEFEGYATTALNHSDFGLVVGDLEIPIESFKFEHIKANYVVDIPNYENENQSNINSNVLILESPLTINSDLVDLISSKDKVNINYDISLSAKETELFSGNYKFDGWTMSSNANANKVTVFLFFSKANESVDIEINGYPIPILDYSFAMGTVKVPHTSLGSNIGKELYIGKVRSWAFNIAEEYNNEILEILEEQMFGDSEEPPIFRVRFKLYSEMQPRELDLLLDDVIKESKETGRSFLTIKFVESGEL